MPKDRRIGWVEDDDLYLEPDAAFAAVQELGNQVGEPLTILSKTLNKRLAERGLLRSQESVRNKHTVRRVIEGARRNVLHLAASLFRGESAQSAHYSTDGEGEWVDSVGRLSHRAARIGPQNWPRGASLRFLRTQ